MRFPVGLRRVGASIVLCTASAFAACDSDVGTCVGPEILPHLSPLNLGNFKALGQGETPNPGNPDKVPYEVTLFLRNTCSAPLTISEACIVGDTHNGVDDETAFTIEGPIPTMIGKGEAAALRITYDSNKVNRDLDNDGIRDPDQVAIVVQSNAKNFPTLVVPVCAMILPNDVEPIAFVCDSPATVVAGKADLTLCE